MKTLAGSLDDDRRQDLSRAWADFAETLREGDGIVHRREYLLILGRKR